MAIIGSGGAFARAKAMFAAISAIVREDIDRIERERRIAAIGAYRSRGKGINRPSYAHGRGSLGGNNAGHGEPHQGAQERIRRQIGGWASRTPGFTKNVALEAIRRGTVSTYVELTEMKYGK